MLNKKKLNKEWIEDMSIEYVGDKPQKSSITTVYRYTSKEIYIEENKETSSIKPITSHEFNCWYRVIGVNDINAITNLGVNFDLHNLIIEDVLNTTHHPKLNEHNGLLFLRLRTLVLEGDKTEIKSEQVSLVLGEGFLISIEESKSPLIDAIEDRLKVEHSMVRTNGVDFLFYSIMDSIVDGYYTVYDAVNFNLEVIEDNNDFDEYDSRLESMQHLKKQLIIIRKAVPSLRDAVYHSRNRVQKIFDDNTRSYLQNLYDQLVHIVKGTESQNDLLKNLIDIYISGVNYRMNKTMNVLTIVTAIFTPLTFIAGIYGMNFVNMPILEWHYGYYFIVAVMGVLVITMIIIFKRRKWF